MAYAFWMWLRIKVLGFLDNSGTVQRLSDPWNINRGRTPATYHLLTGHLTSAWKVTLQTFVLDVLIPDGPDTPGFAQSPWQDHTSLSRRRGGEMGAVFGVWKYHLVFPSWTTCVTAGASTAWPHRLQGVVSLASLSRLACICSFPDSSPDLQHSHAAALMSPECESVEPGSLGVQPKAINHP